MKKTILFLSLIVPLAYGNILHAKSEPFMLGQEAPAHIFVNNRILTKVNGKAISVVDIMKKMDLLFYKQFPQYTSSVQARFQFYQMTWQQVLEDLIDKELVLADATEKKLPITGGDVRQEMESLFGPNIIVNLDKVGLTYDEAWKMVREDIIIRRMIYMRANLKAFKLVTPQLVRDAYEGYAKEHILPQQWLYTVVTIRDSDSKRGAEVAQAAYHLLSEEKKPLSDLANTIKEMPNSDPATKVTVSEDYKHEEKELPPANKEILETLQANSFSQPIAQKSRTDKSTVFRIFYLKEKTAGGAVPFNEVEDRLRQELMDKAVDDATVAYLDKLRKHYHIKENHLKEILSEDFQPFVLR